MFLQTVDQDGGTAVVGAAAVMRSEGKDAEVLEGGYAAWNGQACPASNLAGRGGSPGRGRRWTASRRAASRGGTDGCNPKLTCRGCLRSWQRLPASCTRNDVYSNPAPTMRALRNRFGSVMIDNPWL